MNIHKNIWVVAQVAICYGVIVMGQALWKLGQIRLQAHNQSFTVFSTKYILSKYFIGGALAYMIATVIWIYLLSKYDFNLIYPMNSIGYILAILLSLYVFNETIPVNRYIGVGVIIIGIIVLSLK